MINLAETGATCDCGSDRLAPRHIKLGEPAICGACARCFLVELRFTPIPWSAVETFFFAREVATGQPAYDLGAFEWHRNAVPLAKRRTLAELGDSRGRWRRLDHVGTILGIALAVAFLAACARAVLR